MNMETFERAFSNHGVGCRRECACGKTFFHNDKFYSWEDGELEELLVRPGAVALDYTVGCVVFEGTEYVVDCTCWHERAKTIMRFIDGHAREIAEYLNMEKARKLKKAKAMPEVNAEAA